MMKFSTSSFVAGFMLGVLLAGAWFIGGNTISVPIISSSQFFATTTSTANEVPESGALSVVSQPFGDTVMIESVTVPPPGIWIAVREVNGNDLGNILGAVRVGGPLSNFPIPLLRATESGHSYAAELYRDDDNGVFDPSVNSVYIDFDTGARVVAYFTATDPSSQNDGVEAN